MKLLIAENPKLCESNITMDCVKVYLESTF